MTFTDTDFRRYFVERAVSAGLQDPKDLEDIKACGHLTMPSSFSKARSLCISMAREHAAIVDAKPPRKRHADAT